MSDDYFKSLFDTQILMLTDIKDDIRDLKDDVSNLKTDVAVVKADVQNVKNEVNDLKQTVTNHINSDIHEKNKRKSLTNTPSWMLILFVFLFGRISVDVVDQIQAFSQSTAKQEQEFAPANSTAVDLNHKINSKIIKKLVGE